MIRSSVDLPEPLGPRSAVSEPPSTASETSSSAWKSPKRLRHVADDDRHQTVSSFGSDQGHGDEHEHGDEGEHDRDRVRAGDVERLPALLDAEGGGLRLALEATGDDGDRAVLAEAARGREHDAVDHRPADRGQRDPAEGLPAGGAERARRLLLLVADLAQGRHHLAGDERQGDEDRRDHHRRQREEHLDPVLRRASRRASRRRRRAGRARGRRRPARARAAGRRRRSPGPCPGNACARSPGRRSTPKTVFAGTAMAAMISVSLKACSVSGVEIASQAGPKPCSNVR